MSEREDNPWRETAADREARLREQNAQLRAQVAALIAERDALLAALGGQK